MAMHAHRDGETNDAPLPAGLLAQVRGQTTGPILWVLDRQFCDLSQPPKLAGQEDAFLIAIIRKSISSLIYRHKRATAPTPQAEPIAKTSAIWARRDARPNGCTFAASRCRGRTTKKVTWS